jgi:hypothetical protein
MEDRLGNELVALMPADTEGQVATGLERFL